MLNKNVNTNEKLIELPSIFKTSQYKPFRYSKVNQKIQFDNFREYQPKEKKVRILYKKVGEIPKVKFIDNTLKEYQKLVGGQIEVIPYNDLVLVCNNIGKNLNLLPNIIFDYDYIAGNCFVIGNNYKNGYFRSLTFEELSRTKKDLIHKSFKYNVEGTPRIINNEHGQMVK